MLNSIPRRIKNSLRAKTTSEKIFFLHVPKCGGTSIQDALKKNYQTLNPLNDSQFTYITTHGLRNLRNALTTEQSAEFSSENDCILRTSEHILLYFMNQKKVRCIIGHIPFSEIAFNNFGQEYAFVTLLRDPVERWISEFYYNKGSAYDAPDMDISQYVESQHAQPKGTQYVLFLGGRPNGNDHVSQKALQRALDNIQRFAVTGILEDLDGFTQRFEQRFGINLDIGKKNITPKSSNRQEITSEIRQQIENICEPDLEIYQRLKDTLASG